MRSLVAVLAVGSLVATATVALSAGKASPGNAAKGQYGLHPCDKNPRWSQFECDDDREKCLPGRTIKGTGFCCPPTSDGAFLSGITFYCQRGHPAPDITQACRAGAPDCMYPKGGWRRPYEG